MKDRSDIVVQARNYPAALNAVDSQIAAALSPPWGPDEKTRIVDFTITLGGAVTGAHLQQFFDDIRGNHGWTDMVVASSTVDGDEHTYTLEFPR